MGQSLLKPGRCDPQRTAGIKDDCGGDGSSMIQATARIDDYSFAPLHMKLRYGVQTIGTATGFVYETNDSLYLITNWHVASGRNRFTGQPLHKDSLTPDALRPMFFVDGRGGGWRAHDIPLVDQGGNPLWYQHPDHGQAVDVAAVPFTCPPGLTVHPINKLPTRSDMVVETGQDVFILGYPLNIRAGGVLPVWKRASIASEPDIDLDSLPLQLVDTASYTGMSGSPVIAKEIYHYRGLDGDLHIDHNAATHYTLVGVYSGRRQDQDGERSQLGEVWKARVIEEIIAARHIWCVATAT